MSYKVSIEQYTTAKTIKRLLHEDIDGNKK